MNAITDDDLQQLTQQVAHILLTRNWLLSTAESCTGGWLAKCCTDIAGSSHWFERGFITYSNHAKQDMLGVNADTLKHYGAVSEQTACEMAQGALLHSQAQISVAITGIAGPSGGSKAKPVGTVSFAWAVQAMPILSCTHHFSGNRDAIRRQAVQCALNGIIKNARDSAADMG